MASNLAPSYMNGYRPSPTPYASPWLRQAQSIMRAEQEEEKPKVEIIDLLLHSLVSGGTGVLLGIAQAELKDGLDVHKKYPLDAIGALASEVIGYAINSPALVSVGNSCLTVLSFRKTVQLLGALESFMGKKEVAVSGESEPEPEVESTPESDPIVAAGETLDE